MAERNDRLPEAAMDPTSLYREEIITDRRVGTIRVLIPITADGDADAARPKVYVGEAQIQTNMGALPLSFELAAASLSEAVTQYPIAAREAVEGAVREMEEMRRQAASSIVIPRGGAPGLPGGLPGGGKIQIP